jgi:hypothetical protein
MAVDELLVSEDVPMGVQDALGQAGGARRVVQLRGGVGERVNRVERVRAALQQLVIEDQDVLHQRPLHPVGVGLIGDQHLGLRVGQAVADPVVGRRAPTSTAGSHRSSTSDAMLKRSGPFQLCSARACSYDEKLLMCQS